MNSQAFELLTKQLDKIEAKVDGLMEWRYYFTGAAAIVGAIFGGLASLAVAWISSGK